MLHTIVGTKGQLIKMAPVMKEMDRVGVEYTFINASQHGRILDDIASLFQLRRYDYKFYGFGRDINKSSELAYWLFVNSVKNVFGGTIFNKGDYVILHGNAPPALLGWIIAKARGLRIIHVEAGERTYRLLEPFPEELLRRLIDRYSDYLFAFSDRFYLNLKKEGNGGQAWKIRFNTNLDSVRMAVEREGKIPPPSEEYVIFSIHRFETIFNYGRLKKVVDAAKKVSRDFRVIFLLHEPTKRQLEAKHLIDNLKRSRSVTLAPLLDYFSFIGHMNKARYIITDGAGTQEEAYLLGKPCLLMREATERPDYPNTYMSGFNLKNVDHFNKNYEEYECPSILNRFKSYSPSRQIVKLIRENIEL